MRPVGDSTSLRARRKGSDGTEGWGMSGGCSILRSDSFQTNGGYSEAAKYEAILTQVVDSGKWRVTSVE
jgi:hypothetical protein